MSTILLTGAAGFIGSRVAHQLLDRGDVVIGIDNLNHAYDPRLKDWRLARLQPRDNWHFVRGDIADEAALRAMLEPFPAQFDAIINLAARAGVRQSVENPQVYIDTNVTGTLNLLRLAVDRGIRKFVLASTSSLYGGDNPRPYAETLNTDHPLSPYAASKKAAEAICYTYHYLFGLDVSVLRFFTVYGPAGRPDMSMFRFVHWVREGKPVRIFGDGRQERDFTYVDDVARGTVAALRPLGYEIINLGSDRPIVLADALALVEDLTGQKAAIERQPRHPADVQATWADIGKAERLLGWRPQTDFRTGTAALVEWYDAERDWARHVDTA